MDLTDFKTGEKGKYRKKKLPASLSMDIYGKVPPQAKDLEEAVLGAILLERAAFDIANDVLKGPQVFYVDAHQRIYKAMMALQSRSQPIDTLTTVEELRKREELDMIGGPYYLTKLTNSVVSSANIEYHAKIIFQKFIQREVIRIGGEMVHAAYEDSTDAFELLDQTEEAVYTITSSLYKSGTKDTSSLLVSFTQELEHKISNQAQLSGVPSGFITIDKLTHGWQPTDLIILAARPSVGKTAFALNLARNAASNQFKPTPTAFFSLEMSAGQLMQRLVSSESEIPLEKIMKGRINDEERRTLYTNAIQPISKMPLYIDDTAALNIFEFRAKARRLKSQFHVGLIIIDYLQLMSGSGEQNREGEISTISRNLKALAKELEVPIIALSQMSRESEKRENKTPRLSDLRESGAIEQDADAVIFMYRPEYYGIHKSATGESNVGETHISFAKHRNGSLETLKLTAQLWIQKFVPFIEPLPSPASPLNKGKGIDFKAAAAGEKQSMFKGMTFNNQLEEVNGDDPF